MILSDDGSWAIRQPNTVPVASEAFKKPDPIPVVEINDSPKKRVAPPPPQLETLIQPPKPLAVNTIEVAERF